LRASEIEARVRAARASAGGGAGRATIIQAFPLSLHISNLGTEVKETVGACLSNRGLLTDPSSLEGKGFVALDGQTSASDDSILAGLTSCVRENYGSSSFDPDFWKPTVVRDPAETRAKLLGIAGDKYSYRELDDFTDLIRRGLTGVPQVSKILTSGDLSQIIKLEYSQTRLAAFGIDASQIQQILAARNIVAEGGTLETNGANLIVLPSGEFKNEREIGDVIVSKSGTGTPLYLRDLARITRGYVEPPQYLNYYTLRDSSKKWQTHRAITLAIQMRAGEQIHVFGERVDDQLALMRQQLPSDLIFARTSDQPRQVEENVELFNHALEEAIILVVVIALIGFCEWRAALLMAVSIPITLLMTFGMMHVLGWDIQQVSTASLIIALGLLVDDPVVAGDAIKRDLDSGHPGIVAAWLGPTKLSRAILYATITNIVAYLPFGILSGDTGKFLISLPVVMTASLIASRLVSMTFIPLLGYYWLRPAKNKPLPMEEKRKRGFSGYYYRLGHTLLEHRWLSIAVSFVFLIVGFGYGAKLKTTFFPIDLQFLATVDIFLPNDTALSNTELAAEQARNVIQKTADEFDHQENPDGEREPLLKSLTTFCRRRRPAFLVFSDS
jgi:multidrug efflux pump subunit AcrB